MVNCSPLLQGTHPVPLSLFSICEADGFYVSVNYGTCGSPEHEFYHCQVWLQLSPRPQDLTLFLSQQASSYSNWRPCHFKGIDLEKDTISMTQDIQFPYSCWEEGMATHSSIFAWRIPRTEELGGLQSIELQRVRHNWNDLAFMHGYQRGREGILREFSIDTDTLLNLKWLPTRTFCGAHGTLLNVMWQPRWEGGLGGEWIHVQVRLNPYSVHLSGSQDFNWPYSSTN